MLGSCSILTHSLADAHNMYKKILSRSVKKQEKTIEEKKLKEILFKVNHPKTTFRHSRRGSLWWVELNREHQGPPHTFPSLTIALMPIYPGGVAWEIIVKLPKEVSRLTAGMFDEQRRENDDDDDNNCN